MTSPRSTTIVLAGRARSLQQIHLLLTPGSRKTASAWDFQNCRRTLMRIDPLIADSPLGRRRPLPSSAGHPLTNGARHPHQGGGGRGAEHGDLGRLGQQQSECENDDCDGECLELEQRPCRPGDVDTGPGRIPDSCAFHGRHVVRVLLEFDFG
jgi:hypothetical protein